MFCEKVKNIISTFYFHVYSLVDGKIVARAAARVLSMKGRVYYYYYYYVWPCSRYYAIVYYNL